MLRFFSALLKFIAGLLTICLVIWIAGAFAFFTKTLAIKPQMPGLQTEAIVVLTGGDGRIRRGLQLWADGLAPELFISGVHERTSRQQILEQWDVDKPLPFCCVTLGYEATSTIENASEVHDWIKRNHIRTVRLVTSDYHIPRAKLELSQTLPETTFYYEPVPEMKERLSSPYFRYVLFEEYHKYLWRNFQILTGLKGEPWTLL